MAYYCLTQSISLVYHLSELNVRFSVDAITLYDGNDVAIIMTHSQILLLPAYLHQVLAFFFQRHNNCSNMWSHDLTTTTFLRIISATAPCISLDPSCRSDLVVLAKRVTDYGDDVEAKSAFGTRQYWDDVYRGDGDFPMEEYSWYFGYDVIKPHLIKTVPDKGAKILLPGIGNDPMIIDLCNNGYKNLVAFDYSEHAVERQLDLLASTPCDIPVFHMDARELDPSWTHQFDAILEKGTLDAIYLAGGGNIESSIAEFDRVLKPGGAFISVSGVVPNDLRRDLFRHYDCERDGEQDLQAGCFVFRKSLQK
jgi:hypothetical protein